VKLERNVKKIIILIILRKFPNKKFLLVKIKNFRSVCATFLNLISLSKGEFLRFLWLHAKTHISTAMQELQPQFNRNARIAAAISLLFK
jgi:hypothetical protein